ncbi:ryanodine receptor 2-like [Notothenia coriiceps]|uniref:Ryanodine receptor 2-like n=1 Tax=Notothenia coriiceps TaxID=8208 RepID=A0A6I9P639_9TELE|nr:PREDICTED: ryanodine receptor 2-like [Notothenia coriiceps]
MATYHPLIHQHWLPVKSRIQYKTLLLTYKSLHTLAPQYLLDLLHPYTPSRSLRSSDTGLLSIPCSCLRTVGDRAFSVAAPPLWNWVGLHRPVPTPSRPRGPSSSRTLPLTYSDGLQRSQRSTQPSTNDFRARGRRPSRQPRAPEPYRRPPKGPDSLLYAFPQLPLLLQTLPYSGSFSSPPAGRETQGSDLASQPAPPSALGLASAGPNPLLSVVTASVRETILNVRAPSTRAKYECKWKLFSHWCLSKAENPGHCSVATVLEFLQSLLDSGRSHSTLKVYMAAISAQHVGVNGATVGRHRLVSLFLRGALRQRPPSTPRAPAWNLPLVLDALSSPPFEPLAQVGLKWLSLKAAFLLAITSGKRVGELHALSVSSTCLRWNSDGSCVALWPKSSPPVTGLSLHANTVVWYTLSATNLSRVGKDSRRYRLLLDETGGRHTSRHRSLHARIRACPRVVEPARREDTPEISHGPTYPGLTSPFTLRGNPSVWHNAAVVLPLVDQYFKNHRLYFLSTAIHPISSGGHASNKEKEMVTSLFCKLGVLVRHRISLFGNNATSIVNCLQILGQSLDARTVMKTGLESVKAALRLFFESAAEDLEKTQENLKLGQFTHSREQPRGVTQIINYTTFALLPVLSSLFEHIGQNMFGEDLILDDVQVSCYRILYSLYLLGTNRSIYVERQRPALGKCLAAFSAAFPVAFLEPHTNKFNSFSIFNSKGAKDRAALGLPGQVGEVCPLIPNLEKCLEEIMELAESGMRYTQMPHVMEVVLPMLCSYMSNWWEHGPENNPDKADSCCTSVTSEHMNTLLGNILKIIYNNLGIDEGAWMKRLAVFSQPIISKAKAQLLKTHFLSLMEKLKKKAAVVLMDEEQSKVEGRGEMSETELLILDQFTVLIRDLYAFYPLLIRFVDYNRALWLKESNPEAEELFRMVAEVFIFWAKSHNFKREEQNFVVQNEINNMSFLITDTKCKMSKGIVSDQERKKMKRKGDRYSMQTSLIVATLKRLLPVGLNICAPGEQELIALAKNRFTQKDTEDEVREIIKNNLHLQGKLEDPAIRWQMALYRDLPNNYEDTSDPQKTVERVLDIAHVLFHLDQVEHPQRSKKAVWHKLLSKQRKRAVVACFRMAPLYNLPRHRAVNLFLQGYEKSWIEAEEHYFEDKLIEDLAKPGEQELSEEEEGQKHIDPLHQLIQLFSRTALTEKCKLDEDNLYMAYADIMAKSCHDEEDDDGEEVKSFEEKEMEKQKLLYQQARLHDRGAAEMVLQTISASKGEMGPMVASTLKLGIAILNGGNSTVQQKMLDYLKDKKDVGFFQSLAGLMQSCSVLDLNAFERQNKAEGLGMVTEEGSVITHERGEKVMQDDEFTCDLFRFLQLLCEGHNSDFQNYLRTQIGNNTTVNIIISTVDYLLRVQNVPEYTHDAAVQMVSRGTTLRAAQDVEMLLVEWHLSPMAGGGHWPRYSNFDVPYS